MISVYISTSQPKRFLPKANPIILMSYSKEILEKNTLTININ